MVDEFLMLAETEKCVGIAMESTAAEIVLIKLVRKAIGCKPDVLGKIV